MKITRAKLSGTITAPPSKSETHRALLAAALCTEPSVIEPLVLSDDIRATLQAIARFGAGYRIKKQRVVVKPNSRSVVRTIDCRESGTTLRLMIPLALHFAGKTTFKGRARLVSRPLGSYLQIFQQRGIKYQYEAALPLTLYGANPLCGHLAVQGHISSQFLSGLLLAMGRCQHDSVVQLKTPLQSRDYVAMTIETMAHFGVSVQSKEDGRFYVPGGQHYRAADYRIGGDYSNAAFWLVAGLLMQPITVQGLDPFSKQGDRALLKVLDQMGGKLKVEQGAVTAYPSHTHAIAIDAKNIIDLIPVLAVLAARSEGVTRIYNGERLRFKESDRIKSTIAGLTSLGVEVKETDDGMLIKGKRHWRGGQIDSYNDHRIAMAFSIAACLCESALTIKNHRAVIKSYPNFYSDFKALGGVVIE